MRHQWKHKSPDISNELEILFTAGSFPFTQFHQERLKILLQQEIDITRLIALARHHGLSALLAWQVQHIPEINLPLDLVNLLRTELQNNAARNLLAGRELLELITLFQRKGIAVLPFKGPTLTQLAYGNLAVRPFGDLDLLLSRRDIPLARKLLQERGYLLPPWWKEQEEQMYLDSIGQVSLAQRSGLLVELHSSLLPKAFCFDLSFSDLWSRRKIVHLFEQPIVTLSNEDLFLLLCAHGGKHLWTRIIWMCDLARMLHRDDLQPPIQILDRARKLHALRIVLLGYQLANCLTMKKCVVSDRHHTKQLQGLTQTILNGIAESNGKELSIVQQCLFYLRIRERFRDGIRYCLSLAFSPTEADWSSTEGHQHSRWLYYLSRPLRLISKYFGSGKPDWQNRHSE